jgi:hypothetical protein
MKTNDLSRVILAGFFGTCAMTVLTLLSPLVGGPTIDIAAVLGAMFSTAPPAAGTEFWWFGLTWHLINGTIVFALFYSYLAYALLPGAPWMRGLLWGLFLWLVMEVVLMPLTGRGIFADHAASPVIRDTWMFAAHASYGALLGLIAGPQAELPQSATPHSV